MRSIRSILTGKLHIIILATAALLPAAALADSDGNAARTPDAASCFLELQTDALDILPRTVRFDMLEYFKADSVYMATNAMGGKSFLREVGPGFLEVQITDVSSMQIKLLPSRKNGEIIATIYTVGGSGQAPDSELRFYDQLKSIPAGKLMPRMELKHFFEIPRGSVTTMKEIEQTVPFPTIEFKASPDSDSLSARLTIEGFMNQDDYNVIRLFEKPGLTLDWDGSKFRFRKDLHTRTSGKQTHTETNTAI